jgi:hypothetical protein
MAVLVEAISVVLRRASIARSYPGGWDGFVEAVPNTTLCYDDDIARVGFMSPPDVERYVTDLQRCGLHSCTRENMLTLPLWINLGVSFPSASG